MTRCFDEPVDVGGPHLPPALRPVSDELVVSNLGQHGAKLEHSRKLETVAPYPPLLVVEVWTSAFGILANRLEMPEWIGRDPDVVPRGRNGERPNPAQCCLVGDGMTKLIRHSGISSTAKPRQPRS